MDRLLVIQFKLKYIYLNLILSKLVFLWLKFLLKETGYCYSFTIIISNNIRSRSRRSSRSSSGIIILII